MEVQDIPIDLIDILPLAISIRVDGLVMYANHQYLKLSGFPNLPELIGFNADQSIHPDDAESMKKTLHENPQASCRYRAMNKTGDIVHLETSVMDVLWGGEPAQIYLSRDVSKETRDKFDLQNTKDKLLALHSHISELEQADSLDSVISSTFNALSKTLGYDVIDIIQVSGNELKDTISKDQGIITQINGPGITSRAARTQKTQLVEDTLLDLDYIQGAREERMRSELVVPVIFNGLVNYLINIESKHVGFFSDLDVKMVEAIALHMSNAMTRIHNDVRRNRYTSRLEALHRHAAQSSNLYTVDEVATSLMVTLRHILDFKMFSFGLVEDDSIVFRHFSIQSDTLVYPLDGPGVTVRAILTGETQLVSDVHRDSDYIVNPDFQIRSELAVPMKVYSKYAAVLNIESEELDAFSQEDRELVEIIAENVASSLERIQYVQEISRIERERVDEIIQGVSRVTSMVKHDLKGPLSVILNNAYLIKTEIGDRDRALDYINESVGRINEIFNDLGERTLTGNLVKVLGDLVSSVRESLVYLERSDVEVVFESSLEVLFCNYDPTKLRRVVNNLVYNAFEAMPTGGKVCVSVDRVDNQAVIKVSDTGRGIPFDVVDKVFNPYFTTKQFGMGLGLSICKQIVTAHQGSISVSSKLGEGSIFTVSIPV